MHRKTVSTEFSSFWSIFPAGIALGDLWAGSSNEAVEFISCWWIVCSEKHLICFEKLGSTSVHNVDTTCVDALLV